MPGQVKEREGEEGEEEAEQESQAEELEADHHHQFGVDIQPLAGLGHSSG